MSTLGSTLKTENWRKANKLTGTMNSAAVRLIVTKAKKFCGYTLHCNVTVWSETEKRNQTLEILSPDRRDCIVMNRTRP